VIPIISAAAAAAAAKSPRAAMTITASETDGMDARERSHSSFKSTLFITLLIMIVDYVPISSHHAALRLRAILAVRAHNVNAPVEISVFDFGSKQRCGHYDRHAHTLNAASQLVWVCLASLKLMRRCMQYYQRGYT